MNRIPDSEYLKGLANVTDRLAGAVAQLGDITQTRLMKLGLDIQGRAQERAPVDTGQMQGNVTTVLTETGDKTVVQIKFHEAYAATQHEHVELHHERGEAKYLEKAGNEKLEVLRQEILEGLEEAFS